MELFVFQTCSDELHTQIVLIARVLLQSTIDSCSRIESHQAIIMLVYDTSNYTYVYIDPTLSHHRSNYLPIWLF